MLDSRPCVTGRLERSITIRNAGALAAGLLLVLAQVNACAPVKSEPPRAETLPAEPLPNQTEPQPKATAQPKPAEPPQPKAAEPSQPKPAPPARPKPPEPPRPRESAATPPPAAERAAILDLTSLEKRLRDTNAIGVFTKLSLKNEVDDLLERFRTFHEGRGGTTLAELRENYDLLILKVVALLQDKDSALARDISTSREALWSLLKDPVKFKTL
jgi:type IV secretory pathway VirB10-like protein